MHIRKNCIYFPLASLGRPMLSLGVCGDPSGLRKYGYSPLEKACEERQKVHAWANTETQGNILEHVPVHGVPLGCILLLKKTVSDLDKSWHPQLLVCSTQHTLSVTTVSFQKSQMHTIMQLDIMLAFNNCGLINAVIPMINIVNTCPEPAPSHRLQQRQWCWRYRHTGHHSRLRHRAQSQHQVPLVRQHPLRCSLQKIQNTLYIAV